MGEKVIVLPEREDMFRRLQSVSNESHFRERFYPILLKSAGRKLVAGGVVMMFALAIHDYTQGMPPMMAGLVFMYVPAFIDALIDDAEVATAAKEIAKEALNTTKT